MPPDSWKIPTVAISSLHNTVRLTHKKLSYRRETARQLRMSIYLGWLTYRAMQVLSETYEDVASEKLQVRRF